MENYPVGVMIARGDLAIEAGWKNFAIIQEEIMQLCEAAHLPDIWATQVLESLAKKGTPTMGGLIILLGIPAAVYAIHMYYQPLDLLAEQVMDRVGIRW